MRWEYDADVAALYVYLADRPVDGQEEMPDGSILDIDASGVPVGFELLSVWAPVNWGALRSRLALAETEFAALRLLVDSLGMVARREPGVATLHGLQGEHPTRVTRAGELTELRSSS